MVTPLSRRAFSKLISLLAAESVTVDLNGLIEILDPIEQLTPQAHQPPQTAPALDTSSLSGTSKTVLDTISDYASDITSTLSSASKNQSQATFTGSVYNFVMVQGAGKQTEVDYGTALSYQPATTDYASENFRTDVSSSALSLRPGAQAGVGISVGVGQMSGFNGQSSSISVSAGRVNLAATYNESYFGVSASIGIGGGAKVSYANDTSNTTPVGGVSYGNGGSDLENFPNALMESSSDYLTGSD